MVLKSINQRGTFKGFTLVELMITIAIIGIIAAIAIPTYNSQLQSSRRADVQKQVLQLQLQQESWRLDNTSYATTAQLGSPTHDFYTIAVSNTSATTYTITVTARAGLSQANDTGCTTLTLDQSSNRTPVGCW